ncbi:MAG: hypothetical protein E7347_02785 [Clostridiales bacterium]|nr:hypothetical protein [Clostridiales bacterium]
MQDFNDYVKNGKNFNGVDSDKMDKNLLNMVSSLANKFDGKSQNELLSAIYEQAKAGKQRGTLTNADLDNFASMLSPVLDANKRKVLEKVVRELKKI